MSIQKSIDKKIYIPVNQTESSGHISADTLLARNVYKNIHSFIKDSLQVAVEAKSSIDPMLFRNHNTILIDGVRGSGKSTVLINLNKYLIRCDEDLLRHVHVCMPIDPTLLEDHDDLFLNVILAALMSDKAVQAAQVGNVPIRQELAKQLQKLGHSIEQMQSQREQKGLDKLRAFVGNQQLIQDVHDFFAVILKLLGKDLLVITIDDVDTSLQRAFENLEIVRRYLTSPYVLPILSGDLSLYHDVIWRDFHGRLLRDSTYKRGEAFERAKNLAYEYGRKVLPVHYRLNMPAIQEYLGDVNIKFSGVKNRELQEVSLNNLRLCLQAIFYGPTNHIELTEVALAIPSTRALIQLIQRLKPLLAHEDSSSLLGNNVMAYLYSSKSKVARQKVLLDWVSELVRHFKHEQNAAREFLVLQAWVDWYGKSNKTSLLDTPLLNPRGHEEMGLSFEGLGHLAWSGQLANTLPRHLLARIPEKSYLSYPALDIGVQAPKTFKHYLNNAESADIVGRSQLIGELLLHRGYLRPDRHDSRVCVGRVFELVFLGFVRDVTEFDILEVLRRPPFYEASSWAAKQGCEEGMDVDALHEAENKDTPLRRAIIDLAESINNWRVKCQVNEFLISPWLVFNVMHQFFDVHNGGDKIPLGYTYNYFHLARVFSVAFLNFWSAVATVERSEAFGFGGFVSNNNAFRFNFQVDGDRQYGRLITRKYVYKNAQAYSQNIAAMLAVDQNKDLPRSMTVALDSHPFKYVVDSVFYMNQLEDGGKELDRYSFSLEGFNSAEMEEERARLDVEQNQQNQKQATGNQEATGKKGVDVHVENKRVRDGKARAWVKEHFLSLLPNPGALGRTELVRALNYRLNQALNAEEETHNILEKYAEGLSLFQGAPAIATLNEAIKLMAKSG